MRTKTKRIFVLRRQMGRTEYYTTIAGIFNNHTEEELGCTIKELYPVPRIGEPYIGNRCTISCAELHMTPHK